MTLRQAILKKIKLRDNILTAAGIFFLALGKLSGEFPLLIFLGIAPLLALFYNQTKEFSFNLPLFLKIYGILLIVFLTWNATYSYSSFLYWIFPFLYSAAALLTFIGFRFTNIYAKNRLGLLTLVIYWLAMEFLMFQLHPEFSRFMLANAFNGHPHLISWNIWTGFMGVSLWIFLVNIMFYRALLKDDAIFKGKIRWSQMGYALLMICIPFFINTEAVAILREDLIDQLPAMEKQVSGSGEFVGRTALWIAVLMLLYSIVNREMKKND